MRERVPPPASTSKTAPHAASGRAQSGAPTATAADIARGGAPAVLRLQRRLGNQVVQRMCTAIQRKADELAPVAAPLTESDLQTIRNCIIDGSAGATPLTGDADTDAALIAAQIAGERGGIDNLFWEFLTPSEPHMAKLIAEVKASGLLTDDLAPISAPLSDSERKKIRAFLAEGRAGAEPLTKDPDVNAVLMAARIAGDRGNIDQLFWESVPPSEPHMAKLIERVKAAGPLTQEEMAAEWSKVALPDRISYVMHRLVDVYEYPADSAAGIAGNLIPESAGLIPPRIQNIFSDERPLTGKNRSGKTVDFTARDLMENSVPGFKPDADKVLPEKTGLGLAQWTAPDRRAGLFQHEYEGWQGMITLFDMDAQIDYLVWELKNRFPKLDDELRSKDPRRPKLTVSQASERFLRVFEKPANVALRVRERANLATTARKEYYGPDPASLSDT